MEKLKTFQMYRPISTETISAIAIIVIYACVISYELGAAQQKIVNP
ncbi:MAG TPA: hypothetical protein PK199_02605 [Bacteroidales bacterium]|nr:hypothetical protein [Bacteroidales bacterium]